MVFGGDMSHACRQYSDLNYVNYNGIYWTRVKLTCYQLMEIKLSVLLLFDWKVEGLWGWGRFADDPINFFFFYPSNDILIPLFKTHSHLLHIWGMGGGGKWNPHQHKNKQEQSKDKWTPQSQQTSPPNYGLNSPISLQLAKQGWVQLHPWR